MAIWKWAGGGTGEGRAEGEEGSPWESKRRPPGLIDRRLLRELTKSNSSGKTINSPRGRSERVTLLIDAVRIEKGIH